MEYREGVKGFIEKIDEPVFGILVMALVNVFL
jgi:hypothetical protein